MKYIGIDVDDTITDSTKAVIRQLKKYGIGMRKEQRTEFMLHECDALRGVVNPWFESKLFSDAWRDYRSIRLIDQKIPKYIKNLRRRFDGIVIVTSSSAKTSDIKEFLRISDIEYDGFEHVSMKDKISVPVAAMVDDSLFVANFCSIVKPVVLLNQPWNRQNLYHEKDNILSADNWSIVEELVVKGMREFRSRLPSFGSGPIVFYD